MSALHDASHYYGNIQAYGQAHLILGDFNLSNVYQCGDEALSDAVRQKGNQPYTCRMRRARLTCACNQRYMQRSRIEV